MILPVALMAAFAAAPAAAPPTFKIDTQKSTVFMIMLKAPSVASSFSHDHAFRAPDVGGTIQYDANSPERTRVAVSVKTATIVVDEQGMRQRLGLKGEPSDRDVAAITKDMKSADFLDVEKFPEVTFASSSVTKREDGRLVIVGNFTLHGVTKEIELPVSVTAAGAQMIGDGRVVIKQSDFGLKPCSKFLGSVKCADEVTIILHLVGKA